MRKVVQIAVTQDASNDPTQSVLALCDDGTIWRTVMVYGWQPWAQLPDVPQRGVRKAKDQPPAVPKGYVP